MLKNLSNVENISEIIVNSDAIKYKQKIQKSQKN